MLIPVILSGGAGTRLWPVSREALPKPFIRLPGGESLLQQTLRRAASMPGVSDVVTVTNRDHYFLTRDEYADSGLDTLSHHYLLENVGRNTAPAIAAAAMYVAKRFGDDAIMLVLAADHLIKDVDGFRAAVDKAVTLAATGKLVTFGIRPTGPETGFGYIECGDLLDVESCCRVRRFVEKPDLETARAYVASGQFLWNSGMFCFSAGALLAAMETFSPEVFSVVEQVMTATNLEQQPVILDAAHYSKAQDVSIDYAVMERASEVAVVPATFDWSDIGSWNALAELTESDEAGNRLNGDVVMVDSQDCYVQSDGRMVALLGLENICIVDTPDALLVADRTRVQDVKRVVQLLKLQSHDSVRHHQTVHRPWGTYSVLEEGDRFKLKRIVVKPGASLSLQMHHHRSEHWVVVSGMARVVNGENEIFVRPNESTYIPAGVKHRLENPGLLDCVMIEVQVGGYLGEDDIVRLSDTYGRC